MNSPRPVIDYIQKFVPLSEEEQNEFGSYFKLSRIKKRQFIVQPNFVAEHRNFVLQGAFRSYVIGDEGHEHTIALAIEDWWITDYNSYIFQQPATMFVVALEDSIVLQLDFGSEQWLKKSNHRFETFFRIMAERTAAFQQRRFISNLTQSAEERYEFFLDKYPQIAQRVPQYVLASFLGMTTEFLSKIRNRRILRKS
jgi:CRP-like cAMP-binding protein